MNDRNDPTDFEKGDVKNTGKFRRGMEASSSKYVNLRPPSKNSTDKSPILTKKQMIAKEKRRERYAKKKAAEQYADEYEPMGGLGQW